LLKILQEHRLPLLCHTGTFTTRNKFAHSLRLDDPTLDFPEVPIIAAHSGHYRWRDWSAIAHFRQNLFGDLAMWQFTAARNYNRFCRELR
jgi:predicted TIM-barrel fold metal-dependent hydrolase